MDPARIYDYWQFTDPVPATSLQVRTRFLLLFVGFKRVLLLLLVLVLVLVLVSCSVFLFWWFVVSHDTGATCLPAVHLHARCGRDGVCARVRGGLCYSGEHVPSSEPMEHLQREGRRHKVASHGFAGSSRRVQLACRVALLQLLRCLPSPGLTECRFAVEQRLPRRFRERRLCRRRSDELYQHVCAGGVHRGRCVARDKV